MDLSNPFGRTGFGRLQRSSIDQDNLEQEVDQYEDVNWDSMNGQERMMWSSVFGVAFNHGLVSGYEKVGSYNTAKLRADECVRLRRRLP